jgi:oligopeptide transport system ATP-binding protein
VSEVAELLQVRNLSVEYTPPRGQIPGVPRHRTLAVDDVSFTLLTGEALGLVGESACGKTSVAKAVLQLIRPTAGKVYFEGEELTQHWQQRFGRWSWDASLRDLRQKMQIVFQDPTVSLNPRLSVAESIEEPFRAFGKSNKKMLKSNVEEMLDMVGLSKQMASRFPHELSGGQSQRVVIARALALKPRVIFADEPVSALDVSVQGQILNLLKTIQQNFGLSYVYISHDLATVRHMCDRVAVMDKGRIVETSDVETLFSKPSHPHTEALISAMPRRP